jgi:hypothetical protein
MFKDGKGFYAVVVTVENGQYEYLFATDTDAQTAEKMIQYHGIGIEKTSISKV